MALYAIKTPKGKIMEETVTTGYPWSDFWYLQDSNIGENEAIRAAKREGYKKVRVWLTEEKPK